MPAEKSQVPVSASVIPLRPYKSPALSASKIGTWECDVATSLVFIDPVLSLLLSFAKGDGASGIPLSRFGDALHPLDRLRNQAVMQRTLREGGLFVFEHRTNPDHGEVRWILVRGHYDKDPDSGVVTYGRGIAIDVTKSKQDGFAVGDAAFGASQNDAGSPLDRAIDATLAAHKAIVDLGSGGRASLLPTVELLLHELGRQLGTGRDAK